MKADFVKSDTFKALYNLMQYENVLALRLSCETGLRIGDVLKVKPSDIDGTKLTYTAQKTGKSGVKSISPDLSRRLKSIQGRYFVFEGRTDERKHRTRQTVYTDLKRACRELGVPGQVSPHSARKNYAVGVYRKDGLNKAKNELQHDSELVTLGYVLSDIMSDNSTKTPVNIDELAEKIARRVVELLEKK